MDAKIEVYDAFHIIRNEELMNLHTPFGRKWTDEIRKIMASFRLNTDYPENRTLIWNYGKTNAMVLQLEIFAGLFTVVVPTRCIHFYESILQNLINYLTGHIKAASTQAVANNVDYKLLIYMYHNHTQVPILQAHPCIQANRTPVKRTALGREFTENYFEFIIYLHYDPEWNILAKPGVVYQSGSGSGSGNGTPAPPTIVSHVPPLNPAAVVPMPATISGGSMYPSMPTASGGSMYLD